MKVYPILNFSISYLELLTGLKDKSCTRISRACKKGAAGYYRRHDKGITSGVARGGAAKLRVYLKIWKGEKYFEGEKTAVDERKKRTSKKFWDMRQKSREAVNLRSAPGGRHPSYATGDNPDQILRMPSTSDITDIFFY